MIARFRPPVESIPTTNAAPRSVVAVMVCRLLSFFSLLFILVGLVAMPPRTAVAQDRADLVELNLAGEVPLSNLIDAISRQTDTRYLYSADLAGREVTLYTPARLPRSALPSLLGSLLKGANLAVVDSEVPGWKRIVDVAKIARFAQPGLAEEVLLRDGPAAAVTQVIPVRHADIGSLANTFKGFLSDQAPFIALPESGLIIVTDYAGNVRTLVELLEIIDQPVGEAVVELYAVGSRSPETLVEQVRALLSAGAGGDRRRGERDDSGLPFRLFSDLSGRRVIVAGQRASVDEALRLLRQLDTGSETQTKLYRLQNISAERLDAIIRGLTRVRESETDREPEVETTIDEDGNLLVVRAGPQVHRQIETLLRELDQPVESEESPIQFYRLKNANAGEVLLSLLALQQATAQPGVVGGVVTAGGFGPPGGMGFGGVTPVGGLGSMAGQLVTPGLGLSGAAVGIPGTLPSGAFGETGGQNLAMPFNQGNATDGAFSSAGRNQNRGLAPLAGGFGSGFGAGLGGFGGGLAAGQVVTLPGGARISADLATNSLIVFAPSNVQSLYEKLIRSLDQRRPQVMIEAQILAVDTSNDFALGVEVSVGDRQGSRRLFKFTSFGLSEVDPENGALTPIPSLGFNGVLLDPEVADVIVQALSAHSRGRVLASPKVLVNDNQTGTLESVTSVPFESINTVNTISTQSLGGNQQAGTIITVTPHINEDDHLQLEFEVEFSTFAGQGGPTLPPPRQIDRVGSVVTIPDGKTVVVGGLKRIEESESFTGVPWAEKIPVIRELTSLTTRDQQTTSFFLFIRPVVLRDSRFRDLRYLSDVELKAAELAGDDPVSGPILIPCPTPPPPPLPIRRSPGMGPALVPPAASQVTDGHPEMP